MLRDEISQIDLSRKKLREFGFVVGSILLLLGGWFLWRDRAGANVFLTIGTVLFVCGLLVPNWLKYPCKGWMTLALVMGWVVSRCILTVLYFLVITPIGLLTKVAGKDFLDLKFDKEVKSYWQHKNPEENAKEACERQF